MNIESAVEVLKKGPRGGDLTNPNLSGKREWQKSEFNGTTSANGVGMHRYDKEFVETTASGIKNEQPWHTMAAYMLLAGRTNSEIALAAGVTPERVSQVRAQHWFQEKLAILANNEGDDVLGCIRSHCLDSIEVLASLKDHADSDSVRRAAAKDLLELGHGKAVQRTIAITASTHFDSPADEMQQIQEELEALRRRSSADSKPVLEAVTSTSPEIAETSP